MSKIAASAIATEAIEEEQAKMGKRLARQTDGKKVANVVVEKLYDASWAGTGKSKQAMLILTEGDSALSFALAGRSEWGPEKVTFVKVNKTMSDFCKRQQKRHVTFVKVNKTTGGATLGTIYRAILHISKMHIVSIGGVLPAQGQADEPARQVGGGAG